MGFIDTFNDNSIGGQWTKSTATVGSPDASVTVLEQNARVEIQPLTATSGEHYNGLSTVATYDLTDAQVAVQVPQVAGGGSTDTQLAITLDGSNYYAIIQEAGSLVFQKRVAGTRNNTSVSYSGSTHAWWRIRHQQSDDKVYWDTSSDGVNWTNRRSASREIAVTAMKAEVSAGTWQSEGAPGTAYFDNFRLLQTSFNDTLLADGAGLIYRLDEASGNLVNTGPATGYPFDQVSSNWTRQATGLSGPDAFAVQTTTATQASPTYGHAQVTTPPASLDGTAAFSLEIVLKATAIASGVVFIIGAFTETTLSLEFDSGASKLQAGITLTGEFFSLYDLTSGVAALASGWHHVVLTWDGTDFKGYLDGALVLDETLGAGSDTLDMSYPNPRIALMGAPDANNYNVAGTVDVIGIYEAVVLDATQVTAHYTQLGISAAAAFRRTLYRSVGGRGLQFGLN